MIVKDTQIVETVSGSWLRFPNSFKKFHCLVELPGQLLLNINAKSGNVQVHKMDSNNIYQSIGELFISTTGKDIHCSIISSMAREEEDQPIVKQSDAS
ncbi:hypothetical protein PAESOLCIP111_03483 [Paenibacillus solanacearum]|uniref:Uncharacterized protein n=1 Tax=Paenibacillus solanacearum TaxID=2048548 RepID=A0A916NQZ3_9BACL|nr:hypothetical protein [Paenibacillus solanacearum]CAG7633614.1 hypothetical protein PAESOLCIP111_03483 [Paenibacillus solanacearum]